MIKINVITKDLKQILLLDFHLLDILLFYLYYCLLFIVITRKKDMNISDNKILKQYVGGGGMFTSSPYIVLGKSQNNPLNGSEGILTPYLRFMPINDDLDGEINLGLSNTQRETDGVIGVKRDPSSVTNESVNTHSNVTVNEDSLNLNIHGGSTGTF